MSARIIPLRLFVGDDRYGTVHVMPCAGGGFEVSHESASGNSWGSFSGCIMDAQQAIVAAHQVNRDQYDGRCAVSICDAAASVAGWPAPPPLRREDF